MKLPADILEGVASLASLIVCFCSLAIQVDRPSGQVRSPWRTNVTRAYGRHPRLLITIVASVAVAVVCWIAIVVIELT